MLKKHKNKIIIASLLIIGVFLILIGSVKGTESKKEEELSCELYTKKLEEKIEDFLLTVEGINKAKVIVTLDTSSEQVYAQNQSTYDFLIVDTNNGKEPVNITEIYPTVRGIAISCTNGDNDETKMKLTKLISAYLGISSNRIEIVGIR